jgi:hypothetical protein
VEHAVANVVVLGVNAIISDISGQK